MRIVFMGTADFAVPALEAVCEHVTLVVAQPDRPSGRGLGVRPTAVKRKALELGLSVETPLKSRDPEFVERIRSLDADVLLVAAYGQILSLALLGAAKQGGVNLHGSLLPSYRGAAPVQRCVQNGDSESGVTLMQMDRGMDTGDIIAVEKLAVTADETAGELFGRLASLAASMAKEWMPRICSGDYPRTPQDSSLATHAPKVEKHEAELQFGGTVIDEYNRFRAFTPFPGAYLSTKFGRVKVTRAHRTDLAVSKPGEILQTRPDLVVGFADGAIAVNRVQPEGKKQMSGSEWANGARIAVGHCLTT